MRKGSDLADFGNEVAAMMSSPIMLAFGECSV